MSKLSEAHVYDRNKLVTSPSTGKLRYGETCVIDFGHNVVMCVYA